MKRKTLSIQFFVDKCQKSNNLNWKIKKKKTKKILNITIYLNNWKNEVF